MNLAHVVDQTSQQAFTDYAHLTPEGNRIIAEWLFQLIKGMFAGATKPPTDRDAGSRAKVVHLSAQPQSCAAT